MERQLGEPAEVLSDCGERELELRAGRPAQSEPPQSKNALQVRKQHLDLLAIAPTVIATLAYVLEPPLIWRRQRLPTVTVQTDVVPGVEATTVVRQLDSAMAVFRARLPPGYALVTGGTIEDSAKAQASMFVVFPVMLLLMATILMVQLMSFQRLALVMLTAPLALIRV